MTRVATLVTRCRRNGLGQIPPYIQYGNCNRRSVGTWEKGGRGSRAVRYEAFTNQQQKKSNREREPQQHTTLSATLSNGSTPRHDGSSGINRPALSYRPVRMDPHTLEPTLTAAFANPESKFAKRSKIAAEEMAELQDQMKGAPIDVARGFLLPQIVKKQKLLRSLLQIEEVRKEERKELEDSCSTKIATIRHDELETSNARPKLSMSADLLCSYNCDKNDILYIPGAPPRWTPPKASTFELVPPRLTMSASPWTREDLWTHVLRALEAIRIMQPSFNLADIDIVCSMKALVHLIEFCNKNDTLHGYTMHMVEQTLFLDTFEPRAAGEWAMHSPRSSLYQDRFVETTTTPEHDLLRSSKHYRWHRYTLGTLRCAVLVQVEAHTDKPNANLQPSVREPATYLNGVDVVRVGRAIPQDHLATLNCVRRGSGIMWRLPDVFFSKIENQIDGAYSASTPKHVTIRRLKQKNYTQDLGRWAAKDALPELITLLGKLKDIMAGSKAKTCVAISPGSDSPKRIDIYEPELDERVLDSRNVPHKYRVSPKVLPRTVIEQFWRPVQKKKSKR